MHFIRKKKSDQWFLIYQILRKRKAMTYATHTMHYQGGETPIPGQRKNMAPLRQKLIFISFQCSKIGLR